MTSKQVKGWPRVQVISEWATWFNGKSCKDFVAILVYCRERKEEGTKVEKHLLNTSYAPHQTPFSNDSQPESWARCVLAIVNTQMHTSSVFWTTLEDCYYYPHFSDERSERLRIFFKTASLVNDKWDIWFWIYSRWRVNSWFLLFHKSENSQENSFPLCFSFLGWEADWLAVSKLAVGSWLGHPGKLMYLLMDHPRWP